MMKRKEGGILLRQRNYCLDVLKLYFAYTVAVGHSAFAGSIPMLNIDFVVGLFFILSGYFLVGSFDSGKYRDPWQYTMARVVRLWPAYFVSFTTLYLYENVGRSGVGDLVRGFCRSLPEILLVQNIGMFPEGINFPMWQLSTLIAGSFVLFALLQYDRQLTLNVLCPVMAVCGYVCLGQDVEVWGTAGYFVYVPMVRALCALSLGMFLHQPVKAVLAYLEDSEDPRMPALVTLGSPVMAALLWLNRSDMVMILPYIGLLVCLMYSKSLWAKLLRHPALAGLERISLGIYMNHVLLIRVLERHPGLFAWAGGAQVLVYLAVLTVYSMALMKLVDGLAGLLTRAGKKVQV